MLEHINFCRFLIQFLTLLFFQMMFLTFGLQVVSVTSKDAKIGPISNPKTSWDGSGLLIAKRSNLPTKSQRDGATTHGHKLDTRNKDNPTMLNSTSTVPLNPACQFSTMSTMTALHGTMLLAITKNPSSVKTLMNYWTTWPQRIQVYVYRLYIINLNFRIDLSTTTSPINHFK